MITAPKQEVEGKEYGLTEQNKGIPFQSEINERRYTEGETRRENEKERVTKGEKTERNRQAD